MNNTDMITAVKEVITALKSAGYEAYIVGGCVRDMLMGISPKDYDVTTSATPDEVKAVFEGVSENSFAVHDTGIKHGTVTVVAYDVPVEVTTFRIDGDYTDNRRPDSVTFTRCLREDLSRRDFTVNAIAAEILPEQPLTVIDLFGGQEDLKNKIIRAVGEPQKRFNEDGLRILRALRFAAVYGFSIEEHTAKAIHRLCELIGNIAAERIASELNSLICGSVSGIIAEYCDVFAVFIPELADCKGFDQRSKYHDRDVLMHTLNAVDFAPPDKVTRLALLFHDLGKPRSFRLVEDEYGVHGTCKGHAPISAEITREIMNRLKYDNDTRRKVVTLVRFHNIPIKAEEKAVKRLLNRFGEEMFFKLIDIHIADDMAKAPNIQERIPTFRKAAELARKITDEQSCFSLKQLEVKGGDLAEMGYKGREIGEKLNFLLQAVIGEKCENNRQELLNYIKIKEVD